MSDRLLEQLSSLDTSLQRLFLPLRALVDIPRSSACTRLMLRCQGAIIARDDRIAAGTMPDVPEPLLAALADAAGKAAAAGMRFTTEGADLAIRLSDDALADVETLLAAPAMV